MQCSAAQRLASGVEQVTCVAEPAGAPWWIGPLVTFVAAIIAGLIALRSIESARELARRKATLDLIEKFESSEHYRTLTDAFAEARRNASFMHYVQPTDAPSKRTRGHILDYLNHYELVAIGIGNEILDERIYRAWMETAYVRDWKVVGPFIQALRTDPDVTGGDAYHEEAYGNYESMACQWDDDARPLTRGSPPPLRHVDAPDDGDPPPATADF